MRRAPSSFACDQGRLTHLPRPGDNLEEPARLAQTLQQLDGLRVYVRQITQHIE